MTGAIIISKKAKAIKFKYHRWCSTVCIVGALAMYIFIFSFQSYAAESGSDPMEGHSGDIINDFKSRAVAIWGPDNVWVPSPKVWVQYESDLGERSAVDFEKGEAQVQILLSINEDPNDEKVLAHLRQGVSNLILRDAKDPLSQQLIKENKEALSIKVGMPPDGKEARVYLVKKGDSLWKIAKQFDMKIDTLAKINGLNSDATLPVGYPLKVFVLSFHDLTLDATPPPINENSLLIDQIRMADGRPVPKWLVKEFAIEVVDKRSPSTKNVVGTDGIERLVVSVSFKLVSNHIEVRAKRFQPLVIDYANKHNLDPALIMAIIHTESVFNPRARSSTPAYGLMQLVPYTGGQEAYQAIYGEKRKLTSEYLYDPQNNIELGATYFSILKNKYMRAITDSKSRTYCAVAAYNAGASNVGRAFIPRKSIKKATPVLNTLTSEQVYTRLIKSLPRKESRDYVKKVFSRIGLYKDIILIKG